MGLGWLCESISEHRRLVELVCHTDADPRVGEWTFGIIPSDGSARGGGATVNDEVWHGTGYGILGDENDAGPTVGRKKERKEGKKEGRTKERRMKERKKWSRKNGRIALRFTLYTPPHGSIPRRVHVVILILRRYMYATATITAISFKSDLLSTVVVTRIVCTYTTDRIISNPTYHLQMDHVSKLVLCLRKHFVISRRSSFADFLPAFPFYFVPRTRRRGLRE